jgi:hypothetical protein
MVNKTLTVCLVGVLSRTRMGRTRFWGVCLRSGWGRVRPGSEYSPEMRVDSVRRNLADGANPPGFRCLRLLSVAPPLDARHGKRRRRLLRLDGCPSSLAALLSGWSPCALLPQPKLLPSTREQIDLFLKQVVVRAPPPSECRPLGSTSKRTSSSTAWGARLSARIRQARGCQRSDPDEMRGGAPVRGVEESRVKKWLEAFFRVSDAKTPEKYLMSRLS